MGTLIDTLTVFTFVVLGAVALMLIVAHQWFILSLFAMFFGWTKLVDMWS